MNRFVQITLLALTLGLLGCAEGTYPLSGDQCTADDPVADLDANDCTVPGLGATGV